MATQVYKEFVRLGKYLPSVKVNSFVGGIPSPAVLISRHQHQERYQLFEEDAQYRCWYSWTYSGTHQLEEIGRIPRHPLRPRWVRPHAPETPYVLFLQSHCLAIRETVQKIFIKTPKTKQVILCSATISPEIKPVCLKFLKDVCLLLLAINGRSLSWLSPLQTSWFWTVSPNISARFLKYVLLHSREHLRIKKSQDWSPFWITMTSDKWSSMSRTISERRHWTLCCWRILSLLNAFIAAWVSSEDSSSSTSSSRPRSESSSPQTSSPVASISPPSTLSSTLISLLMLIPISTEYGLCHPLTSRLVVLEDSTLAVPASASSPLLRTRLFSARLNPDSLTILLSSLPTTSSIPVSSLLLVWCLVN